jgi:signal transduction histidine kinase
LTLASLLSIEFLRHLSLFADLPEADLQTLYQRAETLTLTRGDWLMREGDIGDALYVVVEGAIEIVKRSNPQDVVLAVREPGEVVGEMALLAQKPRSASGRALQDSQVLRIDKAAFREVLVASPSAIFAMLDTFNARLQSTEGLLRQQEKMAALGTLAAGLAHELNNPAAAVQRAAAQLRESLAELEGATTALDALTPSQADTFQSLRQEVIQQAATPPVIDSLTRSDRESEMQDWLEAHEVMQAWKLAPALVAAGWDIPRFKTLSKKFSTTQWPTLIAWLSALSTTYALLTEITTGAGRLAEIVKAVKAYTYLDQAPVQLVDVQEGLENTLIILRHKLKDGIWVTRDYAESLPRIEAYGSELNQVWTNLIDNAIDAMQGQGQLTLRTSATAQAVLVEIVDTGPGIPVDDQPRLFEPFFTTKPPGQGTGLGLHIAHNIVTRQRGQIQVISQPGATCFRVTLPIQFSKG